MCHSSLVNDEMMTVMVYEGVSGVSQNCDHCGPWGAIGVSSEMRLSIHNKY